MLYLEKFRSIDRLFQPKLMEIVFCHEIPVIEISLGPISLSLQSYKVSYQV